MVNFDNFITEINCNSDGIYSIYYYFVHIFKLDVVQINPIFDIPWNLFGIFPLFFRFFNGSEVKMQ